MKINRVLLIAAIGLLTCGSPLPVEVLAQSTTRSFYISVDGTKQGSFKSDTAKPKIQGSGISYEVKPGPPGKGHAHSLVITKEAGASSPQFFAALFNNEVLKTVTLEFYRVSPAGSEEIFQTIKLTNATVSHIKQYTRQSDQLKNQPALLEDITLVVQHIEITNVQSKTTAAEDAK